MAVLRGNHDGAALPQPGPPTRWPTFFQWRARSYAQRNDQLATVMREPKRGRAAGCMHRAMLFRLDNQRAALRGNLDAEARSGNAAADNDHVEIAHSGAGYELESRRV